MTAHFFMRLVLLASGLLLTTAFVVQSGTLGKIPPAWTVTGTQPAARPAERGHAGTSKPSAASNVVAEGRVVAYPGAEVVVGTEAAGRIVHLEIQEKSVVRKGDLIAELNAEDLKADHAVASARIMEAEADIRFFDREFRRDTALIARNAGTPQNLDVNRRGLDAARRVVPRRWPSATVSQRFSPRLGSSPRSTVSSPRGTSTPERQLRSPQRSSRSPI